MTNIFYWCAFPGLLHKFRNVTCQLGYPKGGPVANISCFTASHADYVVVIEVGPKSDSCDIYRHLDYIRGLEL